MRKNKSGREGVQRAAGVRKSEGGKKGEIYLMSVFFAPVLKKVESVQELSTEDWRVLLERRNGARGIVADYYKYMKALKQNIDINEDVMNKRDKFQNECNDNINKHIEDGNKAKAKLRIAFGEPESLTEKLGRGAKRSKRVK